MGEHTGSSGWERVQGWLRAPVTRIWLVVALVAATAIALGLGPVADLGGPERTPVPWWALALGFALAELAAVHLPYRGHAHTFTMAELPLVVGLHLASPFALVAAAVVGAGLPRLLVTRQAPVKQSFNAATGALDVLIAIIVVRSLAGEAFGPAAWVATAVALTLTTLISTTLIAVVIGVATGGGFDLKGIPSAAAPAALVTLANGSLALAGVAVVRADAVAGVLVIVPAATLVAAYRAYTNERRARSRSEFLHRSSRALQDAGGTEQAVTALLAGACEGVAAGLAELVLAPAGEHRTWLRTTIGAGDELPVAAAVDGTLEALVAAELDGVDGATVVDRPGPGGGAIGRYLHGLGYGSALVAPLRVDERTFGFLVVGNGVGSVGRFGPEDVRLLDALAGQASTILEASRLEEALAQLSALQGELEHQALHDPLTGLANRVLFADRVEHAVTAQLRRATSLAVLFIDLDDFKVVNDSLGHDAGDDVLRVVAARLKGALRECDTPARLGGDEFAVLLDPTGDVAEAAEVARRILRAIEGPALISGEHVVVRASIGVALGNADTSAVELLRNADVAMYSAKAQGKGTVDVFNPHMHAEVIARRGLRNDLAAAIDNGELVAHYQPLLALPSMEIVGVEALVRWMHPTRGMVDPGAFIPLAEESGLIAALGHHMLTQAATQAAEWERAGLGIDLAVNVSGREIDAGFGDQVAAVLADSGLSPARLVLEITETVLLTDAVTEQLRDLRTLGVRVALDDFGTGYSSLSNLRRLPVDVLKIDRSFVTELEEPGQRAFPQAIVALGASLGLEVVAEGVETAAQLAAVAQLGCHRAQGFHLGRAMPAAELEGLLAARALAEPAK